LASCAQEYAVLGLHLLVAGKASAGNNAFIRQQIIPNCSGMIVGSHDLRGDLFVFNLDTMPPERAETFFPGRGYFLHTGQRRLVQVATLAGNETVEDWVRKVQIADSKETEDM